MDANPYRRILAVAAEIAGQLHAANAQKLERIERDRERLERRRSGLRQYLFTRTVFAPPATNLN